MPGGDFPHDDGGRCVGTLSSGGGEGVGEYGGVLGATADEPVPLSPAALFRAWWALTKPVWDREDKARRLALWGEGMQAAEATGEAWARATAAEVKRMRAEQRDAEQLKRLQTPRGK